MNTQNYLKTILLALIFVSAFSKQINAQNLVIASGAGYKKPVTEIINSFKEATGIHVDAIFGNIRMVANQANQSGEVACVIGDKKFLARLEETVTFSDYTALGKGILVLAYRKGLEINSIDDIATSKVSSLFMPQDGKAIYGIAGKECLNNYGYTDKVSGKLTQVATVPQVVSYLLTGEADAGFINLTEALANKDKLGGYIIVPQEKYKLIEIVSGTVNGFEDKTETKKFIAFLESETAKKIFTKYGL